MNQHVAEVARRIWELREILEISKEEVAQKAGIDFDDYVKYESAELDIPISAIYAVAEVLKVDPTVLLTGEAPRMNQYTITRKGKGISVERYKEYSFQALAFNFMNRDMNPMIVNLAPKPSAPELVTHNGQEFNYVLEGVVTVLYGPHKFQLKEGDSIYFDPTIPHGQMAEFGPAKFLTIINE